MNLETGAQRADPLTRIIDATLERAGGWLPFDRFMALALYTPGLGYYANSSAKFGHMPASGSDFVTAPELSPLFGQTLAVAVTDALEHTGTGEVWEFGAGSGALARQLLAELGDRITRYTIVDLSGTLRERQQQALAPWGDMVQWLSELPASMQGVVVGNEVLDAMPVKLLARVSGEWFERGVARGGDGVLTYADRPTDLRPPIEIEGRHDYLTEVHHQAEAFVATLADRLKKGAAFLLDYGFPESEYYHPQRHMGTVMCHRGHQADGNPLADVGDKDITAHVNFTGIALAGQDAGLQVLGYCNQARFLMNCGLVQKMESADLPQRTMAARLIHEHEMGELFKVIGFAAGEAWDAVGFREGDRSHTL
ncbi:SAM-dependent methyltransferase [Variovorax sp. J22R133]|uniref:class I SAM-dependent methyltransferase n=1 Tax=Variovorax brevis TaxID=3053503 RepID=UPI002576C988|nr:SAM-dependent methyltransferase [Variovorax sp. J22R133]MDM0115091.1 SAM-dependent methyltransferase [Variovorax sp. J22R133]